MLSMTYFMNYVLITLSLIVATKSMLVTSTLAQWIKYARLMIENSLLFIVTQSIF